MSSPAKQPRLRAGFGRAEITPPTPFPLAGMISRTDRLAKRVRDPLQARAVAFDDGTTTALVISADLLLITTALREAVTARLAGNGASADGLFLTATHTHSGPGGYWNTPSAQTFMGTYRPEIFAHIVEQIAVAGQQALDDRAPASLSFGETQTALLNYNRRHAEAPIDRTLSLLTIRRRRRNIRLASFGAHPVVAAFRDYHAASADYPGELIKSFEAEGDYGLFVVGPVGGVNVLYPEGPLELEVHLDLLTGLLREKLDEAAAAATPVDGKQVAFAAADTDIHVVAPRLLPDRLAWADAGLLPLRLLLRRFGKRGLPTDARARVPVLRVGDLVLAGFPADLGAGVGLAARAQINQRGLRTLTTASQTDGYFGYVHLPTQYQQIQTEDKVALWMTLYENAMGFGGREVGVKLLEAFEQSLARVAPQ